jgi:hypothetical protein
MNRRDFYKELMSEYTFDSAKVRRHAKLSCIGGKSGSLRKRTSNRRWWHVPATVVAAVCALAFGLRFAFYDRSIPTVTEPFPASIDVRIGSAQRNAAQFANLSFGTRTMFLSFNDSIPLKTMQNALDSVSDTGNIVVEAVYILGADNSVNVISPEAARASQPERVVGAKVYAPVTLIGDLQKQSEVALVEVVTDEFDEEAFVPLAVAGGGSASAEPGDVPPSDELPGTVSLETFVSFNLAGVLRADFIDDYRFTAVTADSVMLCEIYRDDDTQELQIRIVSDFDFGGELLFTFFAAPSDESRLVIRVRSELANTIYLMSGQDFDAAEVVSSSEDLTILAVTESYVFYAVNRSVIYKYDIAAQISYELADFGRSVTFERNGDLSCFVINLGESESARVYDAVAGVMSTSTDVPAGLMFYRNSVNVLTDGENFFGVTLSAIADPTPVLRFLPTGSVSDLFSVSEITEQSVRILLK